MDVMDVTTPVMADFRGLTPEPGPSSASRRRYGGPSSSPGDGARRPPVPGGAPWLSEVTPDVLRTMLSADASGAAFRLERGALHLKHRLVLVEWMIDVCDDFELTALTANLAILYADRVLSKVKVPKTSLQLVALCCILIAATFTEPELRVPTVRDLNASAADLYNSELVHKMETALLFELRWSLYANTPAHFVEAFAALAGPGAAAAGGCGGSGVGCFGDGRLGGGCAGGCGAAPRGPAALAASSASVAAAALETVGGLRWTAEAIEYNDWYIKYFLHMCWQEVDFAADYRPALLAAAVLAAARRQLSVTPAWPPALAQLSGFSEAALAPCRDHILRVYADKTKANGPPAGAPAAPAPMDAAPSPAQTEPPRLSPGGPLDGWSSGSDME